MKTFGDAALAALVRGDAVVGGAVQILCTPPVRVFSGYGTITIDGEPYKGIGAAGLAQMSSGALGGSAQNLDLILSALAPEMLELIDADEVRRAPTTVYRLIWAGDAKTLLGGYVFKRGTVDQLVSDETIGGPAAVKCTIEDAARGLGRRGGRMRSDADQRLVKAGDGFFKNTAYAAQKMLYWGGKRPAPAGVALGGNGPGGNAPSGDVGGTGGRFNLPGAIQP